jgi:hypothetical protein
VLVEIEWEKEKFDAEVQIAKERFIAASVRAFNRMGLYVEAKAVQNATVNTGRMAGTIHKEDAEHDAATSTVTCIVVADAAYSIYVELGFQGHFVPFHVAEDLYYQALRQWGWRIPPRDAVPTGTKHVGKRWLIPRGRKRPVWGVFVKGKARPFLTPALDDLFDSGVYEEILKEEFEKALI